MNYAETILPEFDQEMASTRKVLQRLPEDKLDWKAHPKSHTIGWNANHVADLPNWLAVTVAGSIPALSSPVTSECQLTLECQASLHVWHSSLMA